MDLRTVALDIPPQDTITKDNVRVTVNAVVYFRVADPAKAVVEIEDYHYATSQLAQTTLRSVIGQSELDELLAEREQINEVVQGIIDQGTDPWGIEVTGVEIKDIDLPREMQRAMAKQAEAERERRGKEIAAEGGAEAGRRRKRGRVLGRRRSPPGRPRRRRAGREDENALPEGMDAQELMAAAGDVLGLTGSGGSRPTTASKPTANRDEDDPGDGIARDDAPED